MISNEIDKDTNNDTGVTEMESIALLTIISSSEIDKDTYKSDCNK